MSKKKKEKEVEEVVKEVVVVEEEMVVEPEGSSWTEEVVIAGGSLLRFVESLINETAVRRITVRNNQGKVLFEIPAAVGLLAVFPPVLMYSLVALGFAVMAEYHVSIERVAPKNMQITDESISVTDE